MLNEGFCHVEARENELIVPRKRRTGMAQRCAGNWLPHCHSAELPQPGGDPVHVELLGKPGCVSGHRRESGLLDEACCHRGASLLLGRVEGVASAASIMDEILGGRHRVGTPNVPDAQVQGSDPGPVPIPS